MNVVWHDLECGGYKADLPVWRDVVTEHGEPVLDVGAGTGRVALDLARRGHRVIALDHDAALLSELEHRGQGLPITIVCADARAFELGERFGSIIVPMQTVQLLGAGQGRQRFLGCAARHLRKGGVVALSITGQLEYFGPGDSTPLPLPDIRELDGVVYASQPTAVREQPDGFILERLRERIGPAGERLTEQDVIHLDRVTAAQLEAEAEAVGLVPRGTLTVPATDDHVGSVVVIVGA